MLNLTVFQHQLSFLKTWFKNSVGHTKLVGTRFACGLQWVPLWSIDLELISFLHFGQVEYGF